jgi:hypothetical protein
MTSKPQMPAHSTEFTLSAAEWAQGRICAGTSFTQPLQQGLGSLSLFIPNQLISRQGKSLDYEDYEEKRKGQGDIDYQLSPLPKFLSPVPRSNQARCTR